MNCLSKGTADKENILIGLTGIIVWILFILIVRVIIQRFDRHLPALFQWQKLPYLR